MLNLTLGKKIVGACALLLLLLGAVVVSTSYFLGKQRDTLVEMNDKILLSKKTDNLATNAKEIQLHVIQVQQWLTDISATRGLDGLNDGFDEAEKHVKMLNHTIQETKKLAIDLKLDDVAHELEEILASFAPYYAVGKKMAQAYIDEGPAGGNKMMGEVDKTSEALGERVESLIAKTNLVEERLTSEIEKEQLSITTSSHFLFNLILSFAAISLFFAIIIIWYAVQRISAPLKNMVGAMTQLSKGNKHINIPQARSHDEIGEMSFALHAFHKNLLRVDELNEQQALSEQKAKEDRKKEMIKLADSFEASVLNIVKGVASSSTELQSTAQEMSMVARETSQQSTSVAAASTEASTNVETVASATEELSSSINEISSRVTEAAHISQEAANESKKNSRHCRTSCCSGIQNQ